MGATDGVRQRCKLASEPRRDRAVTLYGSDGQKYQVIDSTNAVREQLEELSRGDTVRVVLEPVRCRGDGWRLTRLDEVTPHRSPLKQPISDSGRSATGSTSR